MPQFPTQNIELFYMTIYGDDKNPGLREYVRSLWAKKPPAAPQQAIR